MLQLLAGELHVVRKAFVDAPCGEDGRPWALHPNRSSGQTGVESRSRMSSEAKSIKLSGTLGTGSG